MEKKISGIILINKEKNCTSHDVVYKVKKLFNTKVGHTGTLDPNATGVLPLLLGNATKISKYLIEHDKIYEVRLKLGIKMDTADIEGNVIEEKAVPDLSEEKIKKVLKEFLGEQLQTPPIYSAIKVNGKKLYEYARSGQNVEIKPRKIHIYEIELLKYNPAEAEVDFKVSCSKGTYIRSLCEDIAEKIGSVGYMKELNRIKVGRFNIEQAVKITELQENKENLDYIKSKIISVEKLFEEHPKIYLNNTELERFLNGVKLKNKNEDGVYRIYLKDAEGKETKFIGLGIVKAQTIKRDFVD